MVVRFVYTGRYVIFFVMSRLKERELSLLESVANKRAPSLVTMVTLLRQDKGLTAEQRESLQNMLSDEMVENGLQPDDEPTAYGRELDDCIGKLSAV